MRLSNGRSSQTLLWHAAAGVAALVIWAGVAVAQTGLPAGQYGLGTGEFSAGGRDYDTRREYDLKYGTNTAGRTMLDELYMERRGPDRFGVRGPVYGARGFKGNSPVLQPPVLENPPQRAGHSDDWRLGRDPYLTDERPGQLDPRYAARRGTAETNLGRLDQPRVYRDRPLPDYPGQLNGGTYGGSASTMYRGVPNGYGAQSYGTQPYGGQVGGRSNLAPVQTNPGYSNPYHRPNGSANPSYRSQPPRTSYDY